MGRKRSKDAKLKRKGAGFKCKQHGLRAKAHTVKNSLVARAEKTLATPIQTWGCVEENISYEDRSVFLGPRGKEEGAGRWLWTPSASLHQLQASGRRALRATWE